MCILDNCPLPCVSFANIFLQSMACFLIPLTLLYTEHKFLILMRLTLPIVSFMEHSFIVVYKKPLLYSSHLSFLLCHLPGVLLFCISYLGLWCICCCCLIFIFIYLDTPGLCCGAWDLWYSFSSVQFSHSVMSDSLGPHESQHARPPCPSPSPGAWELLVPWPGIKPWLPALEARILATGPPGKALMMQF